MRAIGEDGVWEFSLAHAGETVDDFGVAVGGGIVLAQGGAEDAAVGVDRVVGDGVAEELEVNADLVRAAGKWEAVDDTVAFVFVG